MKSRKDFARSLSEHEGLTHLERAVALLWYYRETQQFDERTAGELAADLAEEGFPKPNVTRLAEDLRRSSRAVRGARLRSFKIDVRSLNILEETFGPISVVKKTDVRDSILPMNWFEGTRTYLERLALQINGTYDFGWYDSCAAISRRLMETLIIEIYVHEKRHHEIQNNGVFFGLEKLISYVRNDSLVTLGRNSPKTMLEIKQLGDTAAHDRVYITEQVDIDDVKLKYRRLISELLSLAGITQ